ncbi:hypothetical protein JH06_1769 [Blastocystis sp. subtype 4]|uniref:hypothetical protein n=1 Tax=Blastocystis sp. subtype 4 TaxID=944170 RepID=UPI00071195EC|nr:hypothetical protein JH06_1769 [Blastocystis sp. subtype 4]KNB44234.1 hypothetical protein JH06_1769 [Blastocystis sp. subtype 4]|eukprot:XP_014527677.1 hypothetical protein JH06_1769 [Blastocystis sp. subtype 4]
MSLQFKKRKRSSNLRKSDDVSSEDDVTVVTNEAKKVKTVNMMTSSSTSKPKEVTVNVKSDMSKERFEASGGVTTTMDYEDKEHDKIAQLKAQIRLQKEAEAKGEKLDANVYRGATGYHQYIMKTEDQLSANKFTGTQGPIRSTGHIAISNRFDYQPEICKDYKETGYCSFGDSCKFIHDRSDYKSGWEIEKEWQKEQEEKRKRRERGEDSDADDDNKYVVSSSDEEDLPFACFICRQEFVKPVVTNCGHYFCEKCALEQYRKSPKCYVCGKNTNGCFNKATKILDRLKTS